MARKSTPTPAAVPTPTVVTPTVADAFSNLTAYPAATFVAPKRAYTAKPPSPTVVSFVNRVKADGVGVANIDGWTEAMIKAFVRELGKCRDLVDGRRFLRTIGEAGGKPAMQVRLSKPTEPAPAAA